MKWTEFSESKKEYPEKIVEKMISGFSKATKGLVELDSYPVSDSGRMLTRVYTDFQFYLTLTSPFVDGYRLRLLTFGYDVELTPISARLDDTIFEEIFKKRQGFDETLSIKTEEEFMTLLTNIFKTERFIEVVSGLMKIAQKNKKSTRSSN